MSFPTQKSGDFSPTGWRAEKSLNGHSPQKSEFLSSFASLGCARSHSIPWSCSLCGNKITSTGLEASDFHTLIQRKSKSFSCNSWNPTALIGYLPTFEQSHGPGEWDILISLDHESSSLELELGWIPPKLPTDIKEEVI